MKGIQDSTTNHFGSLIRGGGKFIIPKFQRDYSWDTEQWEDLWLDIENMISENGDHYMGYLVLQSNNGKDSLIIDGQQRFTTITIIILAAIKSIIKLMENKIEVEDNSKRVETLLSTYIGNVDPVTLEYDNLLVLNRNNNSYYKDYIVKLGALRYRNTSYTEKLMKRCFEWYEKQLSSKYTSGKEYAQFITYIVDNLYFTIIKVTDEMNAFRVFETLNARGVQLSSSDLLKNYLFSLVENSSEYPERINILEEKWTQLTNNIKAEKLQDFIRYYWNSKNKTIRANDLFKVIRNNIKDSAGVFGIINEMITYSDIYMGLNNSTDDIWSEYSDEVKDNINLLCRFNLKQHLSLLMSAYISLSKDAFAQVLKDIVNVSFRYSIICGKNPNEVERTYNDIANHIFSTKSYNKQMLKKVYIEDDEFYISFNHKSFTPNSRNNIIVKYILGKYERYKGGSRDVDLHNDNDTIEHIYPQSPMETFQNDNMDALIYRLGNLCLLEKNYNKSIENQGYTEKKSVLCKSSFITTASIPSQYSEWNEMNISDRQKDMSKCAKAIWKIDF